VKFVVAVEIINAGEIVGRIRVAILNLAWGKKLKPQSDCD
jgi:hypothetical protein